MAVDLDGTVTLTDTLHESVLVLVRNQPFFLFLLPFWLLNGLAFLKLKVAENSFLDITTLPYNLPFIDWLREQKAKGKKIVLCTAANEVVAQAVSKHLGLFDDVIASNANINLKSTNKRNALEERFGDKGYDYAGNSSADIEVWAGASSAIVVNASGAVQKQALQVSYVSHIFASENIKFSDCFRALRVHQWLKNLLLFVPLFAAHQLENLQSLSALLIAFLSFSLCASSVYITNDLLDLESDRGHPRKRYRPFASAKLPITIGVAIAPLLIGASIALGAMVGKEFLVVLMIYLILTASYSLVLKRMVLVDCLTLATLYTIRIIAGAAAVSLSLSFWLLAFSVFIFLSLALVKRYAELIVQLQEGKSVAHGRGYTVSDAPLLQTLGVSSGYISALVIALYMRSEDVVSLYAQPIAIWFVLPILLFWVSWVWLKAARGKMHDDPIVFAVKDKASLLVAALTGVVFVYAATGIGI
ncbi:UbiA family prenyltransferase [Pseudomonadota bacterium]|nr:UbiA family prenyltransferase [Pseudomonadota bacterium]